MTNSNTTMPRVTTKKKKGGHKWSAAQRRNHKATTTANRLAKERLEQHGGSPQTHSIARGTRKSATLRSHTSYEPNEIDLAQQLDREVHARVQGGARIEGVEATAMQLINKILAKK